jgi:integrase
VSKENPREYGSGSVYYRKSDARWVGTIEAGWTRTGARRRITVTGKTEAEVKRKLRDKRAQIEREGVASASSRTTVKAWAETWLADRATKDRPKTHTTDRGAVEAWIVPTIGHKRLEQLTPADVRAVHNALRAKAKSTSTALRYHGVLMRLLKAAVQEGVNVPPRVLATDPPAKAVHDRAALSLTESLAALEVISRLEDGSRWAIAFLQGMRQGESLGLTWPEVDLGPGES